MGNRPGLEQRGHGHTGWPAAPRRLRGRTSGQHLRQRLPLPEGHGRRRRQPPAASGSTATSAPPPSPHARRPSGRSSGFARPLSFSVPFGIASGYWPGVADVANVWSQDVPDSGMTFWVVGPGWSRYCPTSTDWGPLAPGSAAFEAYLRSRADLVVAPAAAAHRRWPPGDERGRDHRHRCGQLPGRRLDPACGRNPATGQASRRATPVASSSADVDGATVVFEIYWPNARCLGARRPVDPGYGQVRYGRCPDRDHRPGRR